MMDERAGVPAKDAGGTAVEGSGTAERFGLKEWFIWTMGQLSAAGEWFAGRGMKLMVLKYKAPLAQIKTRSTETQIVMATLANGTPSWTAPGISSPGNVLNMIEALTTQENVLSLKEAQLAVAAGEWDNILNPWHDESVTVLRIGRVYFGQTPKAPSWSRLKATGQSRERITREGTDIESAWKESNQAWLPAPGITFATFQARRTTAEAKGLLHSQAEKAASNERGLLITQANSLYDLCVAWYEIATATFAADTVQGALIRTIPVNYNPSEAPGQLHFTQHYAPAPNQIKLVWEAPRGHRFNLYAKTPSSNEFVKIVDDAAITEWMGQGLETGHWAFKGEAINADGLGEMSEVIVVPVTAAMAA